MGWSRHNVPRSRDEEVLDWIARRAAGESANGIAKVAGKASAVVVQATNQVRDADLAESGEDPARVRRAYW